ncbi:hypothetical protein TWF696_007916 [Orbilia brochopaga]|uniref:Uncharacterized protein n=1 Tax=Orbilia brochopaga TaxID=3140254 RepID=A0AAV9UMN5_9PEZI
MVRQLGTASHEAELPLRVKRAFASLETSWYKLQTTPSLPIESTIRAQLKVIQDAVESQSTVDLLTALSQLLQLRRVLCNAIHRQQRITYTQNIIQSLVELHHTTIILDARLISLQRIDISAIEADLLEERKQRVSEDALMECFKLMIECEEKLEMRFLTLKELDDHEFRSVVTMHMKNLKSLLNQAMAVSERMLSFAENVRLRLFMELMEKSAEEMRPGDFEGQDERIDRTIEWLLGESSQL